MAGKVRVRLYNILLGDAILVTIPTKPKQHILIDVGNKTAGAGSNKDLFDPIMKNIIKELDGKPLDLYVMTHEHMDHVQGLLYASEKLEIDIKKTLKPKYVWLTGSADPKYDKKFPRADLQKRLALAAYSQATKFYANAGAVPPFIQTLLDLNDSASTGKCVEHLRKLSKKTFYVDRDTKLKGKHALKGGASISIWAPEADTSVYYGRFQPLALRAGDGSAAAIAADLIPPSGVDAGAFYNLVRERNNVGDTLLQIDKAANNTSIVFCLEWDGKKLLFSGDAEERSWKEMNKRNILEAVDFLKISHHGSHNGTPDVKLLDKLLPKDGTKRQAAISTCTDSYPGMPDGDTLKEVAKRATIFSTEKQSKPGGWIDVMV